MEILNLAYKCLYNYWKQYLMCVCVGGGGSIFLTKRKQTHDSILFVIFDLLLILQIAKSYISSHFLIDCFFLFYSSSKFIDEDYLKHFELPFPRRSSKHDFGWTTKKSHGTLGWQCQRFFEWTVQVTSWHSHREGLAHSPKHHCCVNVFEEGWALLDQQAGPWGTCLVTASFLYYIRPLWVTFLKRKLHK